MKALLNKLNIIKTPEELAHKGLEILLKIDKTDLDLNLTIEQLAYIGLGNYLSNTTDFKENIKSIERNEILKIKIIKINDIGSKKNVYAGDKINGPLDSHQAEKWEVLINDTEKRYFEVYKNLIHRKTKKTPMYGKNYIVIKGKTDNGIWRAKDIYKKEGAWFAKGWGITEKNKKRHKLTKNEAQKISEKLNMKLIYDDERYTWNFILKNNKEDIVKIWMALWSQK